MVELIVVILLLGILGAVAAPRLLDRGGIDARAYGDQVKSVLRLAQKMAVAQRRSIQVQVSANSVSACYGSPCAVANLVPAPERQNSGSSATRTACQIANVYRAEWLCEGAPPGINLVAATVTFAASGAAGATVVYAITDSAGTARQVTVDAATGYVH